MVADAVFSRAYDALSDEEQAKVNAIATKLKNV
jgi:hypothetical protein